MDWKKEHKPLLIIVSIFLLFFFLPIESPRFSNAIMESLHLAKWYAQEHVLLCLIPAFFIAGAIAVFISQNSVMKYLGAQANKVFAYGVASVSGSILAVCSCTILPLFAGIYKMGAGLLGILFALSFCPTSAALFFGSLVPLSMQNESTILFPSIYGIGTGLPVILFAFIVALSIGSVGKFYNKITAFEKWMRKITGVIFILVGVYYTLTHLFGVVI